MPASLFVLARQNVTEGAAPARILQGPYASADVTNVGNSSAWIGEGTAVVGTGVRIRPLQTVRFPPIDDSVGLYVVADAGGCVLEFVAFSGTS